MLSWPAPTAAAPQAPAGVETPAANESADHPAATASETIDLSRAIAVALAQHPDLEAARARLAAADAQVEQARAGLWPRLVNQFQYTERESALSAMGSAIPGAGGAVKSTIQQDTITMQVPIYTGDRQQLQVRRARSQRTRSAIELQGTRSDLIALVIEAYLGVLRAKELAISAAERTEALAAQRENVQKKLAVDLSTKSDLLKAEVQLAAAREAQLVAESGVHLAQNALNFAMGRDPDLPLAVTPIASLPFAIDDEAAALRRMATANPALRAAEQQVTVLGDGVRLERAGHRPSVNLTGSYGRSARDLPLRDNNWAIVGTVDFKVFDAGLQSAKVREAHQRLAEGQAALRKLRQSLEVQVKNAWRDLCTAHERTRVSRKGLELATEELRLSHLRLEEGLVTLADHLDNQAEYTRAQVTAIIAGFDVLLAQLRLVRLAGGLDDAFVAGLAADPHDAGTAPLPPGTAARNAGFAQCNRAAPASAEGTGAEAIGIADVKVHFTPGSEPRFEAPTARTGIVANPAGEAPAATKRAGAPNPDDPAHGRADDPAAPTGAQATSRTDRGTATDPAAPTRSPTAAEAAEGTDAP